MPTSNKFTDKILSDLYADLTRYYKENSNANPSADPNLVIRQIYCQLHGNLQFKIGLGGEFASFSDKEKDDVFNVLNTFITATPQWRGVIQSDPRAIPTYEPHHYNQNVVVHHYHHHNRSNWFNDYLFYHWLFSDNFSSRNHHRKKGSDDTAKNILIILIGIIVLACTYYAIRYLFDAALDAMARFYNNEGLLQASMSFMSMALGAIMGAVTCSLLFAATLNPLGLLGVSILAASIISAGIAAYATNSLHNLYIEKTHPDAMDPSDPFRFSSDDEYIELLNVKKGLVWDQSLDPIKVKCAIAALRQDIGDMPSPTARFFASAGSASDKAKKNIEMIRQLRKGEIFEVEVGNMTFDLRKTPVAVVNDHSQSQPAMGYVV